MSDTGPEGYEPTGEDLGSPHGNGGREETEARAPEAPVDAVPAEIGDAEHQMAAEGPAPEPADAPLETPANGDSRLHLSLVAPDADGLLQDLRALVARHPGEVPIIFHLATESDGEVEIESPVTVSPSPQLLEELSHLLGAGRVRLATPAEAGSP